ncbi:MAG: alpha/beta hydrolase [Pseudomonadota bacterium]|nr:alpha/beta hydrolase [Pseudomonadota bacterium]
MSSFIALNKAAIATYKDRLLGRKAEPTWDVDLEIGVRFWRRQFALAMEAGDIRTGRAILDSLQTETPDVYEVDASTQTRPRGTWYRPRHGKSDCVVLYFHGGGYAFYGAMSRRFGAMLAHHIGAPVFAPDYRLTPEHPHPAQAEDAMAAWRGVTADRSPKRIVVIGDSAGGHMMLCLLLNLKEAGLPQPALAIGLCPWTDIGDRGASLRDNDRYDLVQGWMALRFGQWLDPEGRFGRAALSPIAHDFSGCAPLYLQSGGREVLRDMICEFAQKQARAGADVLLDVWPAMPHDFQLFDSTQAASIEALQRIAASVRHAMSEDESFGPGERTEVSSESGWAFSPGWEFAG